MVLKDKVSIITGGGRGIGRQIALSFANEGSHIVLCDVDHQTAERTRREVEGISREALSFGIDITNSALVDEMVNKTLDKFGKIDILINNAGITRDALLVRMKEEDWNSVLDVNLKGTFNCTRAVARVMIKQRKGRIINISSIIGIIGNAGQANYAASKAGIIGFTKSIAKELAPRRITVNAIAPGFIQTDMTQHLPEEIKAEMLSRIPRGEFGTVEDVARVVLFLAADDADYITGQVIQVDGGMAM